jgi:selenide, water dikinase
MDPIGRACQGQNACVTPPIPNNHHNIAHTHLRRISRMTEIKLNSNSSPRLTSLSHGGGCGCKIAPGILADLLKRNVPLPLFPDLLVGNDTADDAAVYRLNDEQAIVATTDFFMPIVDDPFDFGRIAATNALSDVYAMGGKPILALALVGMPINVLPHEVIAAILKGGESICAEAGIPVAGGHSIDSVEPIYGLAAIGVVHPKRVKRNASARPGDVLILGKPLGVGVLSAALKKDQLDAAGYAAMIAATTKLNRPGADLAALDAVHALTDVTGFGLLGHTLELSRGAKLTARLRYADLPWLPGVEAFAKAGVFTGASGRNWTAYGQDIVLAKSLHDVAQTLLTDPQTSGGLLVSCAPEAVDEVLAIFRADGFDDAAVIGEMIDGESRVEVV